MMNPDEDFLESGPIDEGHMIGDEATTENQDD